MNWYKNIVQFLDYASVWESCMYQYIATYKGVVIYSYPSYLAIHYGSALIWF